MKPSEHRVIPITPLTGLGSHAPIVFVFLIPECRIFTRIHMIDMPVIIIMQINPPKIFSSIFKYKS